MEWQQLASLAIVGVTAILFVRARIRSARIRPYGACDDCRNCAEGTAPATPPKALP